MVSWGINCAFISVEEFDGHLSCNINYLGDMIDAKTTYFRHPTHRFQNYVYALI